MNLHPVRAASPQKNADEEDQQSSPGQKSDQSQNNKQIEHVDESQQEGKNTDEVEKSGDISDDAAQGQSQNKDKDVTDDDDDDDDNDGKQAVAGKVEAEADRLANEQDQNLKVSLHTSSDKITNASSSFPAPDPATSQAAINPADTPPLLASGEANNHVNPWDLPDVSPKASLGASIIVLIFSITMLTLGGFYLRRAYRRRKLRQTLRQDMYELGDESFNDTPTKSGRKSSMASPLRKMRRSEKAVKWQSEEKWEDSWKEDQNFEKGESAREGESDDERLGRGYGLRRC